MSRRQIRREASGFRRPALSATTSFAREDRIRDLSCPACVWNSLGILAGHRDLSGLVHAEAIRLGRHSPGPERTTSIRRHAASSLVVGGTYHFGDRDEQERTTRCHEQPVPDEPVEDSAPDAAAREADEGQAV